MVPAWKIMKLSLIMPVYDEEATVEQTIKKVLKQKKVFELIVVDDGSRDKTPKILQKLTAKNKRRLRIFRKRNGGKGSAVQAGLKKVRGDYVLIQDADCEYDPADISALLKPIREKKAEIVYGSRFLGPHSNLLFWHRVGNTFLNFLTNLLYNTTLSDMETCYKLLPTKIFRSLKIRSNDFGIEPEITCKLLRQKVRIYEVPISYVGRDFSQGKKMNWKHGFSALWTIVRLRVY